MTAVSFFGVALAKLFLVMNPIFVLPSYLSLTSSCSTKERNSAAMRSCIFAFCLLTFFALLGKWFLAFMGIGLDIFRVAGGILLFASGYSMVTAPSSSDKDMPLKEKVMDVSKDVVNKVSKDVLSVSDDVLDVSKDVSIFPLGFPLIAGPGSISILLGLMSDVSDSLPFYVSIICVIAVILLVVFCAMMVGQHIMKFLGKSGQNILQKVAGLVISAIAVQMVFSGAIGTCTDLLKIVSSS